MKKRFREEVFRGLILGLFYDTLKAFFFIFIGCLMIRIFNAIDATTKMSKAAKKITWALLFQADFLSQLRFSLYTGIVMVSPLIRNAEKISGSPVF